MRRSCPEGVPSAKTAGETLGDMFYTYILKSESTSTFYYGHTHDLKGRLKIHNAGKVRSTKGKRPWKIHYFEAYNTKGEAIKRELFFKSIDGYCYLKNNSII
jgi:putative endonuclease